MSFPLSCAQHTQAERELTMFLKGLLPNVFTRICYTHLPIFASIFSLFLHEILQFTLTLSFMQVQIWTMGICSPLSKSHLIVI